MNTILCIGEALIDMICTDRGSTLSAGQHFLKKPGGAPTNVAAAIGALGGCVQLVARVGNDPFGQQLVEVMQSFGVDTRHVARDKEHFTTLAFVSLLENGERDFYFCRGADGQLDSNDISGIRPDGISIVHFGSATAFLPGPLQGSYRELLARITGQNIFISFDPNYRHLLYHDKLESYTAQCWHFLERCHFFKVSDEEALLLTGTYNLEDACKVFSAKTRAVFAITVGGDGALLGWGKEVIAVPGIAVKPVDTTGAGDAFVGAVLYQLGEHAPADMFKLPPDTWKQIIFNANKAGARTCEYLGAMEAFKHLRDKF